MNITANLLGFKLDSTSHGQMTDTVKDDMFRMGAPSDMLNKTGTITFLFFIPDESKNDCTIQITTYSMLEANYYKLSSKSVYSIQGLPFLIAPRMTSAEAIQALVNCTKAGLRLHRKEFKKQNQVGVFASYEIPEKTDKELSELVVARLQELFN